MKLLPRVASAPLVSAMIAACAFSAPVQAINLAPNGKGEVLLYPYYTVRNGFDTLFSISNTSDRTVLANLRLREAKNGRPVREFHLILSPHDVWTAAVTLDGSSGAAVRSFDKSCTAPTLPAGPNGSTQIALTPAAYNGADPAFPYDNGGTAESRVQEGFIEVIEMGISTVPEASIPESGSSIESASQHVNGTPRNCAAVQAAFATPENFASSGNGPALPGSVFGSFEAPKNVLFGSATLINVSAGHAYDVTPTTIQNFQDSAPIIYQSQLLRPTLAHGSTAVTARQFDTNGTLVTTSAIANSVDAVSVLLMANTLYNDYANGGTATSGARTDWVVSFPTKHFYTDSAENGSSNVLPPFTQEFIANGRSCDRMNITFVDREERLASIPPAAELSEPAPTTAKYACGSANVFTFGNTTAATSVLGGSVAETINTAAAGTSGWASVAFPLIQADSGRNRLLGFGGLPAIGFAVVERNNSADAGNNRNYGSGRPHGVELIAP